MSSILSTTGHHTGRQSYGRTSVHELNGRIVKVEIHIDGYAEQSYARVKLLTRLETWEMLTFLPSSEWHKDAPSYVNGKSTVAADYTLKLQAELVRQATRLTEAIARVAA